MDVLTCVRLSLSSLSTIPTDQTTTASRTEGKGQSHREQALSPTKAHGLAVPACQRRE